LVGFRKGVIGFPYLGNLERKFPRRPEVRYHALENLTKTHGKDTIQLPLNYTIYRMGLGVTTSVRIVIFFSYVIVSCETLNIDGEDEIKLKRRKHG